MKFYYTYVLQSEKDKSTYIGSTSNLRERLADHNAGQTKSLKSKLPYRLIYFEGYLTKTQAIRREKELKRNSFEKRKVLDRALR
jgi:putative endonuclease